METFSTTEKIRVFGLPGEEQKLVVLFATPEFPFGSRPPTVQGTFKVQFLLARPGYTQFAEQEPTFLNSVIGDSHLGIAKPLLARGENDIESLILNAYGDGWSLAFRGLANDRGYLGKFVVTDVHAKDAFEAEKIAYRALSPFLSVWSLTLDVPLEISTRQVSDLTTHSEFLHIKTPYLEMTPGAGKSRGYGEEFCQYASLYREGMNATSPFYRFLCFYKLVESVYFRRSKLAEVAKASGLKPRRYNEDIPLTRDAVSGLVAMLYPWRSEPVDDLMLNQLVPSEALGKRFKYLRQNHLEPLRNRVAHALMRTGEIATIADRLEDIQTVTKWIPLLRVWVRLLLRTEFPHEFGL